MYMYVYVCICMYVCMYVCIYIYIYIYIYILYSPRRGIEPRAELGRAPGKERPAMNE